MLPLAHAFALPIESNFSSPPALAAASAREAAAAKGTWAASEPAAHISRPALGSGATAVLAVELAATGPATLCDGYGVVAWDHGQLEVPTTHARAHTRARARRPSVTRRDDTPDATRAAVG